MDHSTTHPRIVPILVTHPSAPKKSIFVIALAFFGICSILSGIINIVLSLSTISPFLAGNIAIEIGYEVGLGVLILISTKTFAGGKVFSIWLYGASLIIDCLYHTLMGNPVNYLFVGFGVLLVWQILKFRSELELV